jgi:hypothetical protein
MFLPLVAAFACGGEDTRPATWAYISPMLIQPSCATSSCHGPGAAVAGLDLSTLNRGHDGLTKQEIAKRGKDPVARPLVIPFNPDQSRLVNMLRARGANRMPPDRPFAEADIALVEEWILRGARND